MVDCRGFCRTAPTSKGSFPTSAEQLNLARRRMTFEEVFALSTASQLVDVSSA